MFDDRHTGYTVGDGYDDYGIPGNRQCSRPLAMMLVAAAAFIALLRYWGFRAMVAVGRG